MSIQHIKGVALRECEHTTSFFANKKGTGNTAGFGYPIVQKEALQVQKIITDSR